MARKYWFGPDYQIIETVDFDISPVRYSFLDAYKAGWVSVFMADAGPVVEGQHKSIVKLSPLISNAIGEYYDADPDDVQDPLYDEFFNVSVMEYDERGRPLGVKRLPLRQFVVGEFSTTQDYRPMRIRAYRRWSY